MNQFLFFFASRYWPTRMPVTKWCKNVWPVPRKAALPVGCIGREGGEKGNYFMPKRLIIQCSTKLFFPLTTRLPNAANPENLATNVPLRDVYENEFVIFLR